MTNNFPFNISFPTIADIPTIIERRYQKAFKSYVEEYIINAIITQHFNNFGSLEAIKFSHLISNLQYEHNIPAQYLILERIVDDLTLLIESKGYKIEISPKTVKDYCFRIYWTDNEIAKIKKTTPNVAIAPLPELAAYLRNAIGNNIAPVQEHNYVDIVGLQYRPRLDWGGPVEPPGGVLGGAVTGRLTGKPNLPTNPITHIYYPDDNRLEPINNEPDTIEPGF